MLLDTDAPTAETAPEYLARLRSHGPARAVITGIDTSKWRCNIAGDDDGVWLVETERIDAPDLEPVMFAAYWLATSLAVPISQQRFPRRSEVRDVVILTDRLKKTDLALVEGFDFLSRPRPTLRPCASTVNCPCAASAASATSASRTIATTSGQARGMFDGTNGHLDTTAYRPARRANANPGRTESAPCRHTESTSEMYDRRIYRHHEIELFQDDAVSAKSRMRSPILMTKASAPNCTG